MLVTVPNVGSICYIKVFVFWLCSKCIYLSKEGLLFNPLCGVIDF